MVKNLFYAVFEGTIDTIFFLYDCYAIFRYLNYQQQFGLFAILWTILAFENVSQIAKLDKTSN